MGCISTENKLIFKGLTMEITKNLQLIDFFSEKFGVIFLRVLLPLSLLPSQKPAVRSTN